MQIETIAVAGFYAAAKGARHSYGHTSLDMLDSKPDYLGTADERLLSKLVRRGDDHAKAVRMIQVWATITASTKWWMQFDTYKVGTVRCSESQMHTLLRVPLTQDCFVAPINEVLLNYLQQLWRERDFETLVRHIPQGWRYTSVVNLNYQTLRHMYQARARHRWGREWEPFRVWIETLPYWQSLVGVENATKKTEGSSDQ
jgi:hypothetical protein